MALDSPRSLRLLPHCPLNVRRAAGRVAEHLRTRLRQGDDLTDGFEDAVEEAIERSSEPFSDADRILLWTLLEAMSFDAFQASLAQLAIDLAIVADA